MIHRIYQVVQALALDGLLMIEVICNSSSMKKIAILGPSGAGKSWLARELSSIPGINMHIIQVYNKDKYIIWLRSRNEAEDFLAQLKSIVDEKMDDYRVAYVA